MNILLMVDHPMSAAGYTSHFLPNHSTEQPIQVRTIVNHAGIPEMLDTLQGSVDLFIIDQMQILKHAGDMPGFIRHIEKVRAAFPACKVLFVTVHTEVIIVYDILKKLKPDGLLTACDLSSEILRDAVAETAKGNIYKSKSVRKVVQAITEKEVLLDEINRQILLYMARGYKVKEIEEVVSLSISPIQRRISQMRECFKLKTGDSLIQAASDQGFI